MIKKLIVSFMMIFLGFLNGSGTIFAAEDGINSINIGVRLQEDGSAIVTEFWDINNVFDGTEYFIVMNLPRSMSVHSLEVWDENGTAFEILDEWDVDASFEEKAYRAGILRTPDGYEICWGISRFGDRVFTVRYVVTNLVQGFEDGAGFRHQFVGTDLSSQPDATSITFSMEGVQFSEENAEIGISGFDGSFDFIDGTIVIEGQSVDFANVAAQFDANLFQPLIVHDGAFSDFEESSDGLVALFIIVIMAVFGGVVAVIATKANSTLVLADGTKVKKPRLDEVRATPALPFGGSVSATAYALSKVYPYRDSSAFCSYLLKWEDDGVIHIEKVNKNKFKIIFTEKTNALVGVELALYQILTLVANNGVLTSEELGTWHEGQELIHEWEQKVKAVGKKELQAHGWIGTDQRGKDRFTSRGFEQVEKLVGFMKYLQALKKTDKEVDLDQVGRGRYVVFATLLGMTKEMKVYFTNHSDDFDPHFWHMYQIMLFMPHINHSIYQHQDSSSSTNFGGGGFTGGGGGGGSR